MLELPSVAAHADEAVHVWSALLTCMRPPAAAKHISGTPHVSNRCLTQYCASLYGGRWAGPVPPPPFGFRSSERCLTNCSETRTITSN